MLFASQIYGKHYEMGDLAWLPSRPCGISMISMPIFLQIFVFK